MLVAAKIELTTDIFSCFFNFFWRNFFIIAVRCSIINARSYVYARIALSGYKLITTQPISTISSMYK